MILSQEEFERRLMIVVMKAKIIIQRQAPFRTGNLFRSIKVEATSQGYRIYVDTNQAPYMKYTEEPWNREQENPNQKWFKKAVDLVVELLKIELDGSGSERKGRKVI